ncbi:MAG TPA: hypothetical protein VKU41_18500 [Polyangiaceae bacterium]|nr:hypothetical protein [Polyangiaceae bacterium]
MAARKKTAKGSKTRKAPKGRPGKATSHSKVAKKSSSRKVAAPARRKATPKRSAKRSAVTAAAKKSARRPSAKKAKAAPVRRRERAGHFDPAYARDLLAQSGRPDAEPRSFIEKARASDDLAEGLAEEFVEEVTSGENDGANRQDQVVSEERGGPFVVTTAGQEYAEGTDASNPKGADREPFPKT